MSKLPPFPTGLYWRRTEVHSFRIDETKYAVLWLVPPGFRYIDCWPGHSGFDATGTWQYKNGQIYCRGRSHSFTDAVSDGGAPRPDTLSICSNGASGSQTLRRAVPDHQDRCQFTMAFAVHADGQGLTSVDADPQEYARLSPHQLGPIYALAERATPTRPQDFQALMWKIETQLGLQMSNQDGSERPPFD